MDVLADDFVVISFALAVVTFLEVERVMGGIACNTCLFFSCIMLDYQLDFEYCM